MGPKSCARSSCPSRVPASSPFLPYLPTQRRVHPSVQGQITALFDRLGANPVRANPGRVSISLLMAALRCSALAHSEPPHVMLLLILLHAVQLHVYYDVFPPSPLRGRPSIKCYSFSAGILMGYIDVKSHVMADKLEVPFSIFILNLLAD